VGTVLGTHEYGHVVIAVAVQGRGGGHKFVGNGRFFIGGRFEPGLVGLNEVAKEFDSPVVVLGKDRHAVVDSVVVVVGEALLSCCSVWVYEKTWTLDVGEHRC